METTKESIPDSCISVSLHAGLLLDGSPVHIRYHRLFTDTMGVVKARQRSLLRIAAIGLAFYYRHLSTMMVYLTVLLILPGVKALGLFGLSTGVGRTLSLNVSS